MTKDIKAVAAGVTDTEWLVILERTIARAERHLSTVSEAQWRKEWWETRLQELIQARAELVEALRWEQAIHG